MKNIKERKAKFKNHTLCVTRSELKLRSCKTHVYTINDYDMQDKNTLYEAFSLVILGAGRVQLMIIMQKNHTK